MSSGTPDPRAQRDAANRQLHETLADLASELDATPQLDPAVRDELAAIAEKIRRSLRRSADERESQSDDEPPSVPETLEQMAVDFSASHPRLARVIDEVSKALAGIGI
jgi:hypothetical protein